MAARLLLVGLLSGTQLVLGDDVGADDVDTENTLLRSKSSADDVDKDDTTAQLVSLIVALLICLVCYCAYSVQSYYKQKAQAEADKKAAEEKKMAKEAEVKLESLDADERHELEKRKAWFSASTESGQTYYFNDMTKERTWRDPRERNTRKALEVKNYHDLYPDVALSTTMDTSVEVSKASEPAVPETKSEPPAVGVGAVDIEMEAPVEMESAEADLLVPPSPSGEALPDELAGLGDGFDDPEPDSENKKV